jgi:hypothetical protein
VARAAPALGRTADLSASKRGSLAITESPFSEYKRHRKGTKLLSKIDISNSTSTYTTTNKI